MPDALQPNPDVPTISARHLVSFYQQPHYPVETVCDYLVEGLSAGEAAVAMVTPEHAESIKRELNARGLQLDKMTSDGRFACADAASTLDYLLDAKISKTEKDAHMARWVEETLQRAPSRTCRFLTELVSMMVSNGAVSSALEFEDTWNHLLAAHPAALYCTYEQTPFEASSGLSDFCHICNRHDAVLTADLKPREGNEPPAWFVMLQEQASALRDEVMR